MTVRLQKLLAEAGVASRRAAEGIILAGRVTVNGTVIKELGTKVQPGHDRVAVDGNPVKVQRKLYVALHKPKSYLCTRQDPHGRRTVFDLLPKEWKHLYPVGRLDNDSEGLIFLTNDGAFSLRVTHPRYRVMKTYQVASTGKIESHQLRQLRQGVIDDGEELRAQSARVITSTNLRSITELELTEGKNREVRRLFAACGLTVERLIRIRVGPVRLGELPSGKWRTLTDQEINSLLQPL